jgi:hypothetical protein
MHFSIYKFLVEKLNSPLHSAFQLAIAEELLEAEDPELERSYGVVQTIFYLMGEHMENIEFEAVRAQEVANPQSYLKQTVQQTNQVIAQLAGMATDEMAKISEMGGEAPNIPHVLQGYFENA